jgi:hypothetical protein
MPIGITAALAAAIAAFVADAAAATGFPKFVAYAPLLIGGGIPYKGVLF